MAVIVNPHFTAEGTEAQSQEAVCFSGPLGEVKEPCLQVSLFRCLWGLPPALCGSSQVWVEAWDSQGICCPVDLTKGQMCLTQFRVPSP